MSALGQAMPFWPDHAVEAPFLVDAGSRGPALPALTA